jgi:hypothetical protein
MNRRSFFRFLGAGAATLALSEAIPFGRVWSFPSKIVVPETVAIDLAYYSDFSVLYLQPAMIKLANDIDQEFRRDQAYMSGKQWPAFPGQRTTITLERTAGIDIDFEYLPA